MKDLTPGFHSRYAATETYNPHGHKDFTLPLAQTPRILMYVRFT